MNRLYFGDNLKWLSDRKEFPDASVDLVYLDPPFNPNADYNVLFREPSGQMSQAQFHAFTDTWSWADAAETGDSSLNRSIHAVKYSDKYRILRFERLKQIAAGHGGACLSTQYVSSAVKLRWRCARGHEWEALANNIARCHWCMICGNERQGRAKAHSIGIMDNIAASRGAQCLSSSYC